MAAAALVLPEAAFIYVMKRRILRATWRAYVRAAIPEELGKLLTVRLYAYRHQAFDEPMDGVVYGAAAA